MTDFLGRALVIIGFAVLGFVANTLGWLTAASFDPDPTVGGAYSAMAMLCALPATIAGAFLGGYIVWRIK